MKKEKRKLILFTVIIIAILITYNIMLTKEQSKGRDNFKGYTKEQCQQYYYNYIND